MSGIAHLPGPNAPYPPSQPLHIVPVIPPTVQWSDPPAPPSQYFLPNQPPKRPAPRPRKPYTTTKVREMWTPAEHERMIEGLRLYKRDWAKVTSFVGTRSAAQVRSHAQKYFDRVARDKTDEYVPRARPKRKSTAPYPRKVREDGKRAYQVPVQHAQPYEVPVPFAPPLHPVRITPAQSPVLSHVPSPYLARQPVQPVPPVPHRMYTPFVEMSPTSHRVHPQELQSPVLQSPVSYVSGQYAASPSIPPQISIPAQPMYGVLSPITPAAFSFSSGRASMTHTPVTVYGQPGMVGGNVPMPTPRHSHPEGPIEGCAKCNALQRYGAVLQEIGELNHAHAQPEMQAHRGGDVHGSSLGVRNPAPGTDRAHAASLRTDSRREGTGDGADHRQAPSSPRSVSPRKKVLDTPSPACSDGGNERVTNSAPGNRAHRAKIMRARKLKRNATAKERRSNPRSEYEDQSESANSTPENHRRVVQQKDSPLPANLPLLRQGGAVSRKRKMPAQMDRDKERGEVGKKHRTSRQHARGRSRGSRRDLDQNQTAREGNQLERKRKLAVSERRAGHSGQEKRPSEGAAANNAGAPSSKSDERETGPRSPLVETYSPRERMELFDAVHSLQILAKTSSTGSPSSRSKGDPRRSSPKSDAE